MKVSSTQAKNFFRHVIKHLQTRSNNFNYTIKSPTNKPDVDEVRTKLQEIADNVAVNKMELEFVKNSNQKIYNDFSKDLDEIKDFEDTLSESLSKINVSHLNETKPRRSLIYRMKRNVSELNQNVDHLIKVRMLKSKQAYSKLENIENLMQQIVTKYDEIIGEAKKRKRRHDFIESKMHEKMGDKHLQIVQLREKLHQLEMAYDKAKHQNYDSTDLVQIKQKINLLKARLGE